MNPAMGGAKNPNVIEAAAELIRAADALLITAGAGMGVDSGLPDFRGTTGFWRAYPALAKSGIVFHDIASPQAFASQPRLAWGFYGHRLNLYRQTRPHRGFGLLLDWLDSLGKPGFVVTSNVDGQFQRAGFAADSLYEVHGSIHHLQCQHRCREAIWPADDFQPQVDEARCELIGEFPLCPYCGGIARPNILMFGDGDWLSRRSDLQGERWSNWRRQITRPVVIELGAGQDVATIRWISEQFCSQQRGRLIRINPRDVQVPSGGIAIPKGAETALAEIGQCLSG